MYYVRATPRDLLKHLLDRFDEGVRDVLEQIIGGGLSDSQWAQATLGVKQGGLGVRTISEIADAAYIASRAETYENCKTMDDKHVWDDGLPRESDSEEVIGEWLDGALRRYDEQVDHHSHLVAWDRKGFGGH